MIRSSKRNQVERPNLERSLATLAVSALAASDAEAFATVAAEVVSAALDTPVTIVRGEDDKLAVEFGATGHELDLAEQQFVENALAVVSAADERQRRDATRQPDEPRPADDVIEYRKLLEELPFITYIDLPGEDIPTGYLSPQIEEILGYEPEALAGPGDRFFDIVHPEDRERMTAHARDALNGHSDEVEYRVIAADGRIVWLRNRSVPQLDATGAVTSARGFMLDITREKTIAATVSEERYRSLIEEMPGVVYVSAAGTAPMTLYISPHVEEMVGYTPSEIVANPELWIDTIVHPGDRELVAAATVDAAKGTRSRSEYRCTARNGRLVWVHAESIPQLDSKGNVVAVRGYIFDITDRKVAEEGRSEADARFRALVEEVPGVVYVDAADETGSAIYLSPQVESLFGYSLDDWFSTPDFFIETVLHPDDRKRMLAEIAEDNAGIRGKSEYRCIAKDGRVVWIYDESVPQFDQRGAIVATRGFMIDITDRKIAEGEVRERDELLRQSQRMEAVGRLAGGVAHDFNNLLTVIKGHVDRLAGAEGLDDLAREELASVATAAGRAAVLTRQLLAFSRQQVLQPVVLNLGGVVSGLTAMLRRLLVERIGLRVDSEPGLWSALIDRSQLEQVVVNLVVNARDAMPEGGTISIATGNVVVQAGEHEGALPGEYVALSVSDTGVGVDPEVREQMFEPFFTTKGPGEGTGLGLATVHGIVEQSGGQISVESTPGEGTTVRVLFPRVEAVVEVAPRVPASPPRADGESILLVEDDPDVRALVRLALKSAGYSVIDVPDPDEAILVASQATTKIDMVLTDLVMPGMNGRELAENLVTGRPEMKVLLMSGYTDDEVVRHGVSGASPFIQKPFLPNELVAKVHAVLQGTGR